MPPYNIFAVKYFCAQSVGHSYLAIPSEHSSLTSIQLECTLTLAEKIGLGLTVENT